MWIVHSTNNNNLKASSEFISLLRGPHSGVAGGAGAVPGEVADVDQGGGGLLPADCALAVAVDHVLEDPGEPPGGVPLGGELGQLVLEPDLADVAGVAQVGVSEAVLAGDGLVYPAGCLAHVSVHPGGSVLPAADAPGHDAGLDVGVGVVLGGANQGAAAVSLAGVLAIDSSSTDETVVELELPAQPGLPEAVLAGVVVHHGEVDLLQDHLVLPGSPELVLPPPGGEAGGAAERLPGLGQAGGVDVVGELELLAGEEDGEVVLEVARLELGVDLQVGDLPVLVGPGLGLVLGVPLATPHLQLARALSELVHTVGGGEDHAGGDERSSALVEVDGLRLSTVAGLLLHGLGVQDGAHVGPLAELGLRLSEALDPGAQPVGVPPPALGGVLHDGRGRGRDEVGVLAADVQEP